MCSRAQSLSTMLLKVRACPECNSHAAPRVKRALELQAKGRSIIRRLCLSY
jgi:hypothetical protein